MPDDSASPKRRAPKLRQLTAHERATLDRMDALARDRGLSWSRLARAAGMSDNLGSQWSSRRAFPSGPTLEKVAAVLCVSLSVLMGSDAEGEGEQQLLVIFRSMSPAERTALLAAARGMRGCLGD